jgi:hypothetical protein
MFTWSTFLGAVLVLYAIYVIYRGRITVSDDYNHSSWVSRAQKPFQFWLSVFVLLVIAAVLLFNIIRF